MLLYAFKMPMPIVFPCENAVEAFQISLFSVHFPLSYGQKNSMIGRPINYLRTPVSSMLSFLHPHKGCQWDRAQVSN